MNQKERIEQLHQLIQELESDQIELNFEIEEAELEMIRLETLYNENEIELERYELELEKLEDTDNGLSL